MGETPVLYYAAVLQGRVRLGTACAKSEVRTKRILSIQISQLEASGFRFDTKESSGPQTRGPQPGGLQSFTNIGQEMHKTYTRLA